VSEYSISSFARSLVLNVTYRFLSLWRASLPLYQAYSYQLTSHQITLLTVFQYVNTNDCLQLSAGRWITGGPSNWVILFISLKRSKMTLDNGWKLSTKTEAECIKHQCGKHREDNRLNVQLGSALLGLSVCWSARFLLVFFLSEHKALPQKGCCCHKIKNRSYFPTTTNGHS